MPGARTHWHRHPLSQTVFVTEGVGLCQRRGGPVEIIRPGDRVLFEADEEHWHGAAPNRLMVHLAINEGDDDHDVVHWLDSRHRRGVRRRPGSRLTASPLTSPHDHTQGAPPACASTPTQPPPPASRWPPPSSSGATSEPTTSSSTSSTPASATPTSTPSTATGDLSPSRSCPATRSSGSSPPSAPTSPSTELGDRVGVGCMVNSCGECTNCRNGDEQYCLNGMVPTYAGTDRDGTTTQGGYSTHVVVDADFVLSVPDGIDPAAAAPLLCAGITTYSPLRRWGAGPGKKVAIVGLGGLGHMAVKLAHALGADVTVLSQSLKKQEDGLRLGAEPLLRHVGPRHLQRARRAVRPHRQHGQREDRRRRLPGPPGRRRDAWSTSALRPSR